MGHVDWFSRLMLVLAGILGAGGVVAAAAASHMGEERVLGAVSLIALTHASAALAFGLMSPKDRLLRIAAIAIGAGAFLFTASLASQTVLGVVLVPVLAPTGGTITILGWVLLVVSGLTARR